ncbi:conserved hypothetical protein [Ruegeria sp. TrichCH4B]|nr:conserved hypothetical protein [Ruegeria sp. TrichCH4B]
MMSASPTWAVVATVAEPIELIAAFAAYHIEMGAAQVFLFLDAPRPGDADILEKLPGVQAICCDAAYWQERLQRARPDSLTRVQRVNANYAYEQTSADWLFHIDADEYLVSERGISDVLADVSEQVDYLRVQNLERVYRPHQQDQTFTTLFRVPFEGLRWQERDLFGSAAVFTHKGFAGYTAGKGAGRADRELKLALHKANFQKGAARTGPPNETQCSEILLAHFDGFTPLSWMAKLLRYTDLGTYDWQPGKGRGKGQRKRAKQIDFARYYGGELRRLVELHMLLKVVLPDQEQDLTQHGWLLELPVDPVAALRKLLPDHAWSFSADSVNASLRARAAPQRQIALNALQQEIDAGLPLEIPDVPTAFPDGVQQNLREKEKAPQ